MSIARVRQEPLRRTWEIPDTPLFRGAFHVVKTLHKAGYEAYLVGGSIRDLLMGMNPVDCDIATNALPEAVIRLFPRTVPVGVQFGTVMVLQNNHPYEVTTFRADGRYEDGRRPSSVSFSREVIDDLERRDLTINGLIYSLDTGEVLDYTEGMADIDRRLIRTIGPPQDRFAEDRLRMLRAVRFAARLAFHIDSHTFAAIRNWAPQLHDVSVERIHQEFLKMIQGRYPARGLQLLHETRLLEQIFPEITIHATVVSRLLHYESWMDRKDALALALLLADMPAPQAEAALLRLRFSKDNLSQVSAILQHYPTLTNYPGMSEVERKRFLRDPYISDLLAFASILQSEDKIPLEALQQAQQDRERWTEADLHPPRLLDGKALKQLGYKPGPHFSAILLALEEEQLSGTLQTLEQAKAWLQQHFEDQKG